MALSLGYHSVAHRTGRRSKWFTAMELAETRSGASNDACQKNIIAASDVLVAVPTQNRQIGNVAWQLVDMAIQNNIPALVIRPDGSIKEEL